MTSKNPVRIHGIEFVEYGSADANALAELFIGLGFTKIAQHGTQKIDLYKQHDIRFLLNQEPGTFAETFYQQHGPSICSMGWRVDDAEVAFAAAVERGARPYKGKDQKLAKDHMPAIYGIGDSLIYFVDCFGENESIFADYTQIADEKHWSKPLLRIDHLTNNVPKGEMQKWCEFYEKIFGFQETRYFDIRGQQTGLQSKVMSTPDKAIIIPINEPTEGKSQIQEYLDEYKGSGVQHVALSTADICESIERFRKAGIEFLDVPDTYYDVIRERIPKLEEDVPTLQKLKVLVDGDAEGYLLQIFSKNVIGPIFYEIIQRKNHWGFGEGNFQALFDAIERDQKARGYLD